jgi:hypothetical protein
MKAKVKLATNQANFRVASSRPGLFFKIWFFSFPFLCLRHVTLIVGVLTYSQISPPTNHRALTFQHSLSALARALTTTPRTECE